MSVLSLPIEPQTAKNGDMYYNTVEQEYYNFVDGEWVKQVNEDNATTIVQEVVVDEGYLKNTATGNNSLTVGGTASSNVENVNIGIGSSAGSGQNNTVIGKSASTYANGAVAVGRNSKANGNTAVALGAVAEANAQGAIMLGGGKNTEAQTFKVALRSSATQATDESNGLFTVLESDGTIPAGRYKVMVGADGTTAGTKGVVPAPTATDNTKFLRGDGTWAEVQSGDSLPDQTGHAGEFLTTDGTDASWSEIKQSLWSGTVEEFKNQTCDLYAWSDKNIIETNIITTDVRNFLMGKSNVILEENRCLINYFQSGILEIGNNGILSSYSTRSFFGKIDDTYILLPSSNSGYVQTSLEYNGSNTVWTTLTSQPGLSSRCMLNFSNVIGLFGSKNSTPTYTYSMDKGQTWTDVDLSSIVSSTNCSYVDYVNGKAFIYMDDSLNTFMTSDGKTFTTTGGKYRVRFYKDGYYYANINTNQTEVYISEDGLTWSLDSVHTWDGKSALYQRDVIYTNGYYFSSSMNSAILNYSTDLINWYEMTIPESMNMIIEGALKSLCILLGRNTYSVQFVDYPTMYTMSSNPVIGDSVFSFYTPLGDTFINSVSSNKINVGGYEFDRNNSKDLENTTLSLSNIDKNVVANVKDVGYFHSDDVPCLSKPILSKDEENELSSKGSLYGVYQKYNSKFSTESGLKTFKYTNKYEIHFNKPFKPIQNAMYYPRFGNNVFVSIASSGSTYSYSSDGITWNSSTLSHATGSSLKFINGMFITTGTSSDMYISTSSDGITWTSYSVPHTVSDIAYGNNKYVYLPSDVPSAKYTSFYYSSDLTSWTEITHPDIATYGPSMICFGNNMFVSVAYSSSTAIKSSDGITWTEFTMPMSGCDFFECINGKFYALFRDSSKGLITEDCINWTEFTLPKAARWGTIVYGNNKFIALTKNSNSNACAVSYDGINWFENEYPNDTSISSMYMYGACYGNNKFVVGLASNGISYASQENSLSLEQETYTIPTTDFSSSSTQTLKNVNGTIKWVTDS